jgi:hypothetical protein
VSPTQLLIAKILFAGVPLLIAMDGLTKGRFRLIGPIRMSAGGHIRRSEHPVAFWCIATLLVLIGLGIVWLQFFVLND